jgi:hypothetical protein
MVGEEERHPPLLLARQGEERQRIGAGQDRGHLPGEPNGRVVERPYKAALTNSGQRHPVTRDLPG